MLIIFNKPFNVLSQFTDNSNNNLERETLSSYVSIPDVYPAGRLDRDSEGLLLLTDNGKLQARISQPENKMPKTYWVQVEGILATDKISNLEEGVLLRDGMTSPAKARIISEPKNLWTRNPPIRKRKKVLDSWIELTVSEGKNRQVRRMTAAIGHPTLRLIRAQIGIWSLDGLQPGEYYSVSNGFAKSTIRLE